MHSKHWKKKEMNGIGFLWLNITGYQQDCLTGAQLKK